MAFIPCLYDEWEHWNMASELLMVRCKVTEAFAVATLGGEEHFVLTRDSRVLMIEEEATIQPRHERLRLPLFAHLYGEGFTHA